MANYNELYRMVAASKTEALFESTADMDSDDIAYLEMCQDIYMERYVAGTPDRKVSEAGRKQTNDIRRIKQGEKPSISHPGMSLKEVKDYEDFARDAFDKLEKARKKAIAGKVVAALAIVGATAAAIGTLVKRNGNKAVEKKVEKLEKEITEIKNKAKDGEISPKDAEKKINELSREIEEIVNSAKKDAAKEVKESVDSIRLEIFESCHNGEITEEERDELLALL